MKVLLTLAITLTTACAQGPSGAVDGIALPSKAFATCNSLQGYIRDAPRAKAVQEFGITVTPEEEAASRAKFLAQMDNQQPSGKQESLQWAKDHRDLLPAALAEVYEQHEDPNQVYADKLAGSTITEESRQFQVNSNPAAKTPTRC